MSLRSAAETADAFGRIDHGVAPVSGVRHEPSQAPDMTRSETGVTADEGAVRLPETSCAVSPVVDPALKAGAERIGESRLKRGVDVAVASLGLLFMSPFLMLLALVIRLESPGPALFKQRRTGLNGKTFVIYKFRTMRVIEDGGEIVQASANDRRTTSFGRFLRRSSIDEMPQLLNVLKGEMSLIGPRPHALAHDEFYAGCIPSYNDRFLVRPGLSGLAQVRGCRGATPRLEMMADRVRWDLTYIETWSPALELRVFLDTIVVFFLHPAPF